MMVVVIAFRNLNGETAEKQVCHSERSRLWAAKSKNPHISSLPGRCSVRKSFDSLMLAQDDTVILTALLIKRDNHNNHL